MRFLVLLFLVIHSVETGMTILKSSLKKLNNKVKCLFAIVMMHTNAEISDLFGNPFHVKKNSQKKEWLYKDYMKKFDVLNIYQSIEEKYKKSGRKFTLKDELHNIMKKMDETDELLSLKVDRGDPKIMMNEKKIKDGRRAAPGFIKHGIFTPTNENEEEPLKSLWDPHYVRYRLNELMKQLIYSTRNKMVGMQLFREEFKNCSMYKMGYLMSKTDEAVKNYIRFIFRSYKTCTYSLHSKSTYRHQLIDILTTQERILFKWFHIDLLTDLIKENDDNAREIMTNTSIDRKIAWKFVD